jgi:hypothetical protein
MDQQQEEFFAKNELNHRMLSIITLPQNLEMIASKLACFIKQIFSYKEK